MSTGAGSNSTDAAWTAQTLKQDSRWIIYLDDRDVQEINAALAYAKTVQAAVPAMTKHDFPLDRLLPKLEHMLKELETGLGVVLLRGLPIERYSKIDAGLILWGIGRHMGRAVAQNAYGDVLGHVFDLGKDPHTDASARGYQSNHQLAFHSDSCDVVTLMCLRTAKTGGASRIVSSRAIHDRMQVDHPEQLNLLYEGFYNDARNEQAPGDPPYYIIPIYEQHAGRIFCRYVRRFIESAQRFAEVPRLTSRQIEALQTFDSLQTDPAYRFDMNLEPGDMQFLNNYVVLHSRTGYEDHEDVDHKRHLLRLWLFTPGLTDVPESFQRRYRFSEQWLRNPRAPIYDLSVLMGATEH